MDSQRILKLLVRVVRNDNDLEISMLDALKELDAMSGGDGMDPQLHHYLMKRSYEKALVLLETGESSGHHQ